jgi:hypothetical protein
MIQERSRKILRLNTVVKVYLNNSEIDSIRTKGCQTMIKSIKAVPAEEVHNKSESF